GSGSADGGQRYASEWFEKEGRQHEECRGPAIEVLVPVQNPAGQRIVQTGRFDLLRHASALVIHLAVGEEEAVESCLFRAQGEIEVFKVNEEPLIEAPQPSEELLAHKKKRAHDVVDVPTCPMIP